MRAPPPTVAAPEPCRPWAEDKQSFFYHGTYAEFSKFDLDHFGRTDDGYIGVGVYFATNAEWASDFGSRILRTKLHLKRPFDLPASGSCNHPSLVNLRERLGRLQGVDPDVIPNTTLPVGYTVAVRERDHPYSPGKIYRLFYVAPQPEQYGTPLKIYGPEKETPLEAIVGFHDDQAGISQFDGWAECVLKRIQRKTLHLLLQRNGYDGIRVFDPDTGETGEVIVFDPAQIEIVGRSRAKVAA